MIWAKKKMHFRSQIARSLWMFLCWGVGQGPGTTLLFREGHHVSLQVTVPLWAVLVVLGLACSCWLPLPWWLGWWTPRPGHCFAYWGALVHWGGVSSDPLLPWSCLTTPDKFVEILDLYLEKNFELWLCWDFRPHLNQAERLESNLLLKTSTGEFITFLSAISWRLTTLTF